MAKDYAKQRNPNAGRAAASRRGGGKSSGAMSGGTGLFVGLSIGLAIAVAVWAYARISRPTAKIALGQNATQAAAPAAAASDDDARKPIKLPPKQPSRFAFYEMLPNYEVVIPREATKPAPVGQPAATPPPDVKQALAEPGQYLIQVGAYRQREEADKHRASLALIGIESRIEQVTIDQKDTWYRVRVGPEPSLAKAQEVLDRLESNDIKGMLVKVKG